MCPNQCNHCDRRSYYQVHVIKGLSHWNLKTSAAELAQKKNIANNSKLYCLDLSTRIHACNAIRYTSVILSGSFVTLSPPCGPGNSMLHICFLVGPSGRKCSPLYFCYTFHCAFRSAWATNHSCIWTLTVQVQSVILPLYFSLRVGIHVGHESPCHLNRAAKLEHVCYSIGAEKQVYWEHGGPSF